MQTRRRRYQSVLPVVLGLVIATTTARAQADESTRYAGSFLEIPLGARALGIGGAYTAIADDGSGFFWNPSGTSLVERKLLSGMYSSQYGTIGAPLANYYFAGWTMPIKGFGISIDWIRLAVTDIPYHDDLTLIPSVEERYRLVRSEAGGDTFTDTEDAFFFSFARDNHVKLDLGWSYFSVPLEIPIGVNVKLIRQNLAENSASAIGVDAGAMLRINLKDFFFTDDWPMVSIGLALRDIGGSKLSWSETGHADEIAQSATFGLAVYQPIKPIDSRLILSVDRSGRYDGETSVGMELQYHRQFSFRAGFNRAAFAAGAGVDFNFFDIDYSYLAPRDSEAGNLGNVHRLAVAFNFDSLIDGAP